MAFAIQHEKDPSLFYAGPDKGWISTRPPKEVNPLDHVVQYKTAKDAQAAIKLHMMDAKAVELNHTPESSKLEADVHGCDDVTE